MKKSLKRILAIICCVAVVLTGISVDNLLGKGVRAADASATSVMSITATEAGFKLTSDGGTGLMNMKYTGVPSDYSAPGANFLDNAFIANYITFGGGMTAADLLDGFTIFYVATDSILQFKWASRTTAFTPGWSFTIAKGAPLPYKTTSGTSYMALDKEYTFTFAGGNATYTNVMNISSINTTTFSMPTGRAHATGKSAASTTEFYITVTDLASSVKTKYTYLQTDAQYADYIDFNGTAFSELTDKSVKIRSIFDGNTKCIQVETWGDLRNDFKVGYQVVFRKGMPIYYTDSDGNTWKALLDGTYVYEGMYSNDSHDIVFSGAKVDENASIAFGTRNYSSSETYVNVGFTQSSSVADPAGYVGENFLADYITRCYMDLSGCSVDLSANGATFKYIPTADTVQLAFGATAKSMLKAGDTIVFKKGMPIVYNTLSNNTAACVVLDDEYTFTVVSNDGTTLVMSCEITGSYSLSGNVSGRAAEVSCYYYNFYLGDDTVWADSSTKFQGNFTNNSELLENYFISSTATAEEMKSEGWMLRRYYIPGTLIGLRFYCPETAWDFETGDYVIFKEGLPVTYTTTSNKTKTTYLDKDYGFRYDEATKQFTYDATLTEESIEEEEIVETFEITTTQQTSFLELEKYKMNVGYTSTEEAATTAATTNILKSTGEAGNTADYVDFCGLDSATMDTLGISIILYPSSSVFQIVWGADVLEWVSAGNTITFKEGMPVYYATGDVMFLSKTVTYTVREVTETSITMDQYGEIGNYALATTQFGTGKSTGQEATALIKILDPQTGENNLLDDANRIYAPLSNATIATYVDVCGLTAEEIKNYGMSFRFIRDGGTQVLQIIWGTSASELEIGSYLIFKQGLPFTYTTTDGSSRKIILDKDYIYEVTGGNEGNTRVFNYVTTTEVTRKEWTLENGVIYNTAQGAVEGYYNNISLGASEMTEDLQSLRVSLDTATLAEYVDFAGIEPSRYTELGIQAIVVIDGNTKVVQLRWGETTPIIEAGDEIIFKKGMPITISQNGAKTIYELDADYVFAISEHADGANGYRLTTCKIDDFNIVITVDGVEVVNDLYKTGTEIDLEQYRNTAVGKVMSIQINGVTTQSTNLVVSENAEIVILNRSDICIVVFKDEGVVVATREYLLADKNVKFPYAPDKDGYDDSWEKFELVNGVIYVNAIHTLKESALPSVKLSGVVIEEMNKPAENNGTTSPQTGDGTTTVAWITVSVAAMMFVILKLAEKNKAGKER